MSKQLLLVYLFIFSLSQVHAFSITGVVESADDRLPVAGATVFINNTQKFCITDSSGNFKIDDVDFSYFDLIVAANGFEHFTFRFTKEMVGKKMRCQLNRHLADKNSLPYHSYNKDDEHAKNWLKIFFVRFIGDTLNNKYNYVLNPEVLKLFIDSAGNILHIKSTDRLLVLNEELGYMVNIYIDDLAISNNDFYFDGYIYFKSLKFRNEESFEHCKMNRSRAYKISLPHFMSALYQNKLNKEGFEIGNVYRAFEGSDEYKKYTTQSNVDIYLNPKISPYKFIYIIDKKHPASPGDFIEKDEVNGTVFINSNKIPILVVLDKNSLLQLSSLLFFEPNKKIRIEANGMFFEPDDIHFDGYWHSAGLISMLPFDYIYNGE